MSKLLPKTVFVRWNDEADEPFLEASKTFADACAGLGFGDSIDLGCYQLKSVEEVLIRAERTKT